MRLYIIILTMSLISFQTTSFKHSQLKYPRVREAYKAKENKLATLLDSVKINREQLRIYIRAFKEEREIELWGKNVDNDAYSLIKTYVVCNTSGNLGPKRRQGDLQIPEGFYHIDRFNPYSNFYLSLGINYPNRSDRILGQKGRLGGDIFIHGNCVTIGCLPITDDQIKELYLFALEAKNNGQSTIPVTIFPSRLSDSAYAQLKERYESDTDKIGLWTDLKKGYDLFNSTKKPPTINFLTNGRHRVID